MFYKPLVGVVLIYAAARFFWQPGDDAYALRKPSRAMVLGVGALLGFVSGLVGVGGGIFLSPLLIFLRWEWVPRVSGVAAAFILVNSLAGLAGYVSSRDPVFPDGLAWWALAAMVGGTLGAHYGAQRLQTPAIKRLLALVLFIAGLKMLAPLTKVFGG